jgi:hypothetical protein
MKTNKAIKECARWLAYCMEIGWDKKDLDMLEKLWWKYHGDNSKIIQKSEEPSKGAEDYLKKALGNNMNISTLKLKFWIEAMDQYRAEGLREKDIETWFYQHGIDTRFAHELYEYLNQKP